MKYNELIKYIADGALDERFARLYPGADVAVARRRYTDAVVEFGRLFGEEGELSLFSVPGRSELSGNHTDHNHGCVIAASIDLDIIAVARPREDGVVRLQSRGFDMDVVTPEQCVTPDPARAGHADALIAGVINALNKNGRKSGGFDAYTTSSVLKGSGLSSSAAFEDMVGTIENYFYNYGSIGYIEIAQMSQYAENRFFGKPCGLMDQLACSAGGIVFIDFADPAAPVVEKVDFDITGAGYALCIVDRHGRQPRRPDGRLRGGACRDEVGGALFRRGVPAQRRRGRGVACTARAARGVRRPSRSSRAALLRRKLPRDLPARGAALRQS